MIDFVNQNLRKLFSVFLIIIFLTSNVFAQEIDPDLSGASNLSNQNFSNSINMCPISVAFGLYSFNYEHLFNRKHMGLLPGLTMNLFQILILTILLKWVVTDLLKIPAITCPEIWNQFFLALMQNTGFTMAVAYQVQQNLILKYLNLPLV